MTDTDLLRTEMAKVMTRANPPIIMTLEDVAAVVGMSYNYVRNELQHQPNLAANAIRALIGKEST